MHSLPKPIIIMIASYLGIADRSRLSRACKKFTCCKPGMSELLKAYNFLKEVATFKDNNVFTYHCRYCRRIMAKEDDILCDYCDKDSICNACCTARETDLGYTLVCKSCDFSWKCNVCSANAHFRCFKCYCFLCDKHAIDLGQNLPICPKCDPFQ